MDVPVTTSLGDSRGSLSILHDFFVHCHSSSSIFRSGLFMTRCFSFLLMIMARNKGAYIRGIRCSTPQDVTGRLEWIANRTYFRYAPEMRATGGEFGNGKLNLCILHMPFDLVPQFFLSFYS